MSEFASVSGARLYTLSLDIPKLGAWVADVDLALAAPLPAGAQTLTLGNLQLAGVVYRQAVFAGAVKARLVGGGGSWNRTTQARGYNSAAGIFLSTVLSDVAIEVGETVRVASDRSLGNAFLRFADTASNVLRAVAGPLWWVDAAGVTQVGARRPATPITTPFEVEGYDGARGELTVSTEDYAAWMPGATVRGPTLPGVLTLATVRHEMTNGGKSRMHVLVR